MVEVIPQSFYSRHTKIVAKDLLGSFLSFHTSQGNLLGRIVETEAYLSGDPTNHAFRGPTKRNSIMFGPAGFAYVYFIYGSHFCLNVVTGDAGIGEAVLFRAVEPVEGLDTMRKNRTTIRDEDLTNGPGKLTKAFGIDQTANGEKLFGGPLRILSKDSFPRFDKNERIITASRIGLREEEPLPLRFYLEGNPFLSRKQNGS